MSYLTVLKIAPAFLLAGTMVQAQIGDSTAKERKIEEVVLVGYGAKKKSDLTGSITSVTSKDFNKGAIVSADQLISGKAPGVRITSDGGAPDSKPNIRIRGGSSLAASNNPLIVIDGVPLDTNGVAGSENPLSMVNPNDIESFSILKDASATAIYGSRASNGVIIITTKRGGGKLKMNFNTNLSIGEVTKYADVLNARQFAEFIQEYAPAYAYRLGVGGTYANPTQPGTLYNTDWQKAIYRNSVSSDNSLSISGTLFKNTPARLSVGYNRTEGVVKTNDYERGTVGFNASPQFFDKHLKIDINAKGTYSDYNKIDEGGAIGGAVNADPTQPIYLSQTGLTGAPYDRFGGYYIGTKLVGDQYLLVGRNPLATLLQRNEPVKIYKFIGNAELNYKFHFLPELRAVVNLGLEASKSDRQTTFGDNAIATYRNPDKSVYPNDYIFNPGEDYAEHQTIVNQTLDSYLVYEKNFSGFLSHFLIQGGYSYQNFKNDGYKHEYQYNTVTGVREQQEGNLVNPGRRYFNELNLQSFIARTNIDFLNKYLFTVTFRADGSSLFQKDNRWGYFPAVAFAWKMKEDFFKDNTSVRDLKLRLGWGKTGNQSITDVSGFYPSSPLFQAGDIHSQYLPGIYTYSALPFAPNLTWETTETMNAGLDFAFLSQDRINGSIDVYKRKTTDLLFWAPLPPGQGLTNEFIDNIGSLENKGVEANLNVIPVRNDKTNWTLSGNIAYNKGEITNLKDVTVIADNSSTLPVGNGVKIAYQAVGQNPYSAYVFEQVYDANGKPLADVYVDRNNDGKITNDDRYFTAIRPKWTYGFGSQLNYLNWDFSTAFRGQIGGKVYNTKLAAQGVKSSTVPKNVDFLNNGIQYTPTSPFESYSDNIYYSDYFLQDASFLKWDNFTVGYLFKNIFDNVNLRVYGSVNNIYTFTKFDGQDPENFNGIDNNFYPRPRTYTVGLNFNF